MGGLWLGSLQGSLVQVLDVHVREHGHVLVPPHEVLELSLAAGLAQAQGFVVVSPEALQVPEFLVREAPPELEAHGPEVLAQLAAHVDRLDVPVLRLHPVELSVYRDEVDGLYVQAQQQVQRAEDVLVHGPGRGRLQGAAALAREVPLVVAVAAQDVVAPHDEGAVARGRDVLVADQPADLVVDHHPPAPGAAGEGVAQLAVDRVPVSADPVLQEAAQDVGPVVAATRVPVAARVAGLDRGLVPCLGILLEVPALPVPAVTLEPGGSAAVVVPVLAVPALHEGPGEVLGGHVLASFMDDYTWAPPFSEV